TTEKGNTNRAIKARNRLVADNHIKQEADNERRISALRKGLAWATEKNARLPGRIGDTKRRADFAKQLSGSSEPHITYCTEQNNRTAIRVDDTKRCVEDAKSGIAWAAKRCENLPKRCDDTKQRIDDTKQAIEGITEAIRKSDIEINRATERSARPAPNPFDDDARRARAARLDRQEGRIDRDTRANRFKDERIFEYVERMKLHLAMRLIQRHRGDMAIRWAQGETAQDAPDKFDQRQVALLNEFAKHHGIEDHDKAVEFTAHLRQVAKRFDHTLVENNKAIIKLLRDPNAEREQYLALTKHFTDFRDNIDQKRAASN